MAEAEPAAVGLKATVTVQEALAARVAAQVFVWLKGVAAVALEVMVMAEMVSALVPELVRVAVWVAEDAPTRVEAKVRLAGETVAAGPEVEVAGQPLTTLATLSEPSPEALSKPVVSPSKAKERTWRRASVKLPDSTATLRALSLTMMKVSVLPDAEFRLVPPMTETTIIRIKIRLKPE